MTDVLEIIRKAREDRDFARVAEHLPYLQYLGIEMQQVGGQLFTVMRQADHIVGNAAIPAIHGGAVGSLLETSAVFEVLWREEIDVLPKTINLTLDYMRSAKVTDTWAEATITKRGRRVINVRAEAWQEDRDKPVAMAHVHLLVK